MRSPPRSSHHIASFAAVSLLPGLLLLLALWVMPVAAGIEGWTPARAMRGFANIWAAGHQALQGDLSPMMDPKAWEGVLKGLYGQSFTADHTWGYPPSMLLVAAPLSLLPLMAAFLVWTVAGPIALFMALRWGGAPRLACWGVLASPAVLENAMAGQTGCLAAALLFGGLMGWSRSPVASGIMIGVLSMKPQIGLLTPVCLAGRGAWRTFAWAALACLGLVAASAAAFGTDSWIRFATETSGIMARKISLPWTGEPWQVNFSSPLYAAIALGLPLGAAWIVQGVFMGGAAWTCWVAARRGGDPFLLAGLAAALELLSSPYSHNYDMTILACAIMAVATVALREDRWLPYERPVLAVGWAWPGVPVTLVAFGMGSLSWLGPVLCAASSAGVAWCCWRRLTMGAVEVRRGQDG